MSEIPTFNKFEDAERWLLERVPITKEQYAKLDQKQRELAFTIAAVANADLIRKTRDSLRESIAKGDSFA